MESILPLGPPEYLVPSPRPFIARDRKLPTYYRGLRVGADTFLHDQLVRLIEGLFPSCARDAGPLVVDLGCGEGALSQRLCDLSFRVVAVDKDPGICRAVGPQFISANFDEPNAAWAALSQWANQADLVLAVEVIEHLHCPLQFLKLCHQLCRPDGHLIVTTPNVASWWSRLWFLLTGRLWGFGEESLADPGHIHPLTHVELAFLLREAGFILRRWYVGGCLPVIWTYNWKRALASLCMLPLRPFMRGPKDGWVICFHAQKPVQG